MDLADDRLGHLFAEVRAFKEHRSEGAKHTRVARKRTQLAEVDAGREDRALAAQQDALHGGIPGGRAQGLRQLAQQRLIHGIALLRPVQDHVAHGAAVLGDDQAHRLLLTLGDAGARLGAAPSR